MSDFVSKIEFNNHARNTSQDINNLAKAVDKVVDKVDKMTERVDNINVKVEKHDISIDKFEKAVDKLTGTVELLDSTLTRVDKETAINTHSIQWNWKTIIAAGFVITLLVSAIGTLLTRIFNGSLPVS